MPPGPNQSDYVDPDAGPERTVLVHVAIGLVALLFVSIVGLLFYRWLTEPVPTALLVVQGSAEYEGATVQLLDSQAAVSEAQKVLAANDYVCRFHFTPGGGIYFLRVSLGGHNDVVRLKPIRRYEKVNVTLAFVQKAATLPTLTTRPLNSN